MEQRTPLVTPVLLVGCVIILVSFAIRASFGVFQIPIADEFGWARSEFSLAIAIQNLAWGIGQPIFAAIAEKFGDRKALIMGALTYAAGLVLSSFAVSPEAHQFYELLVGFGVAGTGFGVILAVVGRAASDENRSMSLAIVSAAGSAGQIFGAPMAEWMLGFLPWQTIFLVFAGVVLALMMVRRRRSRPQAAETPASSEKAETRPRRLMAPHPRTAAGLTRARDRLILVVVDGRQPGYSEGVAFEPLARWMQAAGAHDAVLFDGGGSTTLVARAGDDVAVLNTPVHGRHPPGLERPVACHLGVRF